MVTKKEEKKRVLISTVYRGKANKIAINKLSVDKVILVSDPEENETRKETIKNIESAFGDIIEIKTIKTPLYEIPKITKKIVDIIDEEKNKNNEILLNVTEGRKVTAFGLMFAGDMRKDKIKGAHYVIEESNKVMSLPVVDVKIGDTKKKILSEIEKGEDNVYKLGELFGINQSAVYQHIQELKKEGYLSNGKELNLTDLGRIVIL